MASGRRRVRQIIETHSIEGIDNQPVRFPDGFTGVHVGGDGGGESDSVSIFSFGAQGLGDGVDETEVIQEAIDWCASHGKTLDFGSRGDFTIKALPTSVFTYGNQSDQPVYRALDINRSGLRIIGSGSVLRLIGHDGGSGSINYALATDKNMNQDDLLDIRIKGLRIDCYPSGGFIGGASKPNRTPRAVYFGGVTKLRLKDNEFFCSQSRNAGTVTFQQCRDVAVEGTDWEKTTQGMSFSFVDGVQLSDLVIDDFREGIDFDRQVTGLRVNGIAFYGNPTEEPEGRWTNQCMDLNSVQDAVIENIYAEYVGNIGIVNYKYTTPPTYAEYVNDSGVPFYFVPGAQQTPSKNLTLRGIRGRHIGATGNLAIIVGNERTLVEDSEGVFFDPHEGARPVENITVEDVKLTDTTIILFKECINGILRDAVLEDVITPDSTSFGAVTFQAQVDVESMVEDSELSATVENVVINGATGIGARISTPKKAIVKNLTINGFGTAARDSQNVGLTIISADKYNGQIELSGLDISGGVAGVDSDTEAAQPPICIRLQSDGGGTPSVAWEGNNRLVGDVPIQLLGDIHEYIDKWQMVSLADLPVASMPTDRGIMFGAGRQSIKVARVTLTVSNNVASDSTNYNSLALRRARSSDGTDDSICSRAFNAGITRAVENDLNFEVSEASGTLGPGDLIYARIAKANAGAVWPGATIKISYLPYLTT